LQLSIIIVNYNVQYFLEQCLYSVTRACKGIDTEIFVVDNNSTDGSKTFFSTKFSSVKFIWNTENVGFAKANNQALQLCSGKYILFLNPDTIIPEDCFSKCLAFAESTDNIGGLGIKMIDGTGNFLKESKRGFPSPFASLYKLSGLSNIFPNSSTFVKYYLGNLSSTENHEVDILSGAFMLAPKKVLDIVGSFDDTFFMYGEDIDLSYRIQKAGFKNYYFAESTIIHFKGESIGKTSSQYLRHFYGAMHLFVKKHYGFTRSALLYFFIRFLILIKALIALLNKSFISIPIAKKYRNDEKKRLIVADESDYNTVVELLKKAQIKLNITARIDVISSEKTNALGSLDGLPALAKRYAATEIIFCEKDISFKDIIAAVEKYAPLKIDYMFHASGSCSIIGSNNKNTNGIFIAAK
jgi:GT2 family glycosyltransferase